MNLLLLDPSELTGTRDVQLSDVRATHLLRVLRVAPGHHVRIGLINGPHGVGTVSEITGATVTLRCEFEAAAPERPRVDLLLALPRPKVMRRLWAQLAA